MAVDDGFGRHVGCRMRTTSGLHASHAYGVVFTDADRYSDTNTNCRGDANADPCGDTNADAHCHATTGTYRGC